MQNQLWRASSLLLLVMLLLTAGAVNAQQIYKKVLEDGTVMYTDTPQEDAEQVQVDPVVTDFDQSSQQTQINETASKQDSNAQAALGKPNNSEQYQTANVVITKPSHEQSVRANNGVLDVAWRTNADQLTEQPQYELYVDGQVGYKGPNTRLFIENFPRGEHRLYVRVLDQQGIEMARSAEITFYFLRASVATPVQNNN